MSYSEDTTLMPINMVYLTRTYAFSHITRNKEYWEGVPRGYLNISERKGKNQQVKRHGLGELLIL